jgi:hypothetical protein
VEHQIGAGCRPLAHGSATIGGGQSSSRAWRGSGPQGPVGTQHTHTEEARLKLGGRQPASSTRPRQVHFQARPTPISSKAATEGNQ